MGGGPLSVSHQEQDKNMWRSEKREKGTRRVGGLQAGR